MLRLVFITHGSTGDIVPVIRLAEAAAIRGNQATLLASHHWRHDAESRGIHFIPIPPTGPKEELADLMQRYSSIRNPVKLLKAMYHHVDQWQEEILPKLAEALENADAFCYSYLFPIYQCEASARGIPSVSVHFCPNTYFSPLHPPENLPQLPGIFPKTLRKRWNIHLTAAADRYVTAKINRILSQRKQHLTHWLRSPADYSVVLAPPELYRGETEELPKTTCFTGFVQGGFSAEDKGVEEDIAGVPLLNFGSVTTPSMDSEFHALYRHWPENEPLIIQRGWFDPPAPPETSRIRVIPPSPHSSIFPQASVIIHHGGAGTTTSAFLAGRPQIIIPHFADQPYWAHTVQSLGCGESLRLNGWGKRLARTVRRLLNDYTYQQNAEIFAQKQSNHRGAEEAIAAIESWLDGL